MPYYYEEDYAVYGEQRINAALRRWRPGAFRTFESGVEESFTQYNTLGWLSSGLAEWTAPDDTPIEKEDWNSSHSLYREDVNYTEGLTEGVALARATESDRHTALSFTRQNVDFWSLPNLSGVLLGGLPDPVNLAGMGGFVGRMGTVAKIAQKMPVVKYTAPVLQGSTDTMLAESLFQFTRSAVTASQGGDLDQFAVFGEIALAGAFGGILSTLPMAWQIAKKAPNALHYTWLADARNQVGRQDGPVTVFGREGMIDEGIPDSATKQAEQEDILRQLDEEELGETIIEEGEILHGGERRNLDEAVDDRTFPETLADDIRDAATDPRGTLRNAYESVANCLRNKFTKRF